MSGYACPITLFQPKDHRGAVGLFVVKNRRVVFIAWCDSIWQTLNSLAGCILTHECGHRTWVMPVSDLSDLSGNDSERRDQQHTSDISAGKAFMCHVFRQSRL